MSEHQKTLKIVTNLDRAAVEARLGELLGAAQAAGLADVVALLDGYAGAPRPQLEQKVRAAQKALVGVSGQAALKAQLELVELNLPNL
jgi:hypothetical protein